MERNKMMPEPTDLTPEQEAEARDLLDSIITRWNRPGTTLDTQLESLTRLIRRARAGEELARAVRTAAHEPLLRGTLTGGHLLTLLAAHAKACGEVGNG
jgi:hypothetical protein